MGHSQEACMFSLHLTNEVRARWRLVLLPLLSSTFRRAMVKSGGAEFLYFTNQDHWSPLIIGLARNTLNKGLFSTNKTERRPKMRWKVSPRSRALVYCGKLLDGNSLEEVEDFTSHGKRTISVVHTLLNWGLGGSRSFCFERGKIYDKGLGFVFYLRERVYHPFLSGQRAIWKINTKQQRKAQDKSTQNQVQKKLYLPLP